MMEVIFWIVGLAFTFFGLMFAIDKYSRTGGLISAGFGVFCLLFLLFMYKTTVYTEETLDIPIVSMDKSANQFVVGLTERKNGEAKAAWYLVSIANPSNFGADVLRSKLSDTRIDPSINDSGEPHAIVKRKIRTNNSWFHADADVVTTSVNLVVHKNFIVKPLMEIQ